MQVPAKHIQVIVHLEDDHKAEDWDPDGLKSSMLIWALIIFISLMKDQQFLSAGDSWSVYKLSLRNETKKSKC